MSSVRFDHSFVRDLLGQWKAWFHTTTGPTGNRFNSCHGWRSLLVGGYWGIHRGKPFGNRAPSWIFEARAPGYERASTKIEGGGREEKNRLLTPLPGPLPSLTLSTLPGPDLAARIQDGDLITNSGFFRPSNRLCAGYGWRSFLIGSVNTLVVTWYTTLTGPLFPTVRFSSLIGQTNPREGIRKFQYFIKTLWRANRYSTQFLFTCDTAVTTLLWIKPNKLVYVERIKVVTVIMSHEVVLRKKNYY